ncbi:hypothetical protein L6164_022624 [Bauhinia variegata]|uniref:Uncharacterized protein n=1 Tax=Bauhinia variegata TaxID=167791 RepID=A0ACB9MFM0_BAUVA|nr:hypothetical protein L6164_022624 [Bauhinia variegata]
MDSERPHRTTSSGGSSSTGDLFICFTSRLSSSSMKLSSKSILSPGRSREPSQISLSTSLSRRLKSNGSIKGGQASPMFPTGGKKRGCAFENPEPSSPKVTCIGQVRVKTKKQGRKMRTRSKRRAEASFRKTEPNFQVAAANTDLNQQNGQAFQHQNHQNLQQECLPHRNQRWVHLPLTICEALRAFGAEFSCLFPCRSSCTSSEREKEEKGVGVEGSGGGNGREGSCGTAFPRWLVALQEGDAKCREIELVAGEEDTTCMPERSQRRHVFEDIDINIEKNNEEFIGEEEEKARVSICIPPRNALLLMRCRSDPVKMAALANRFFESPAPKDEEGDDNEDDEERVHMEEDEDEEEEKFEVPLEVACEEQVIPEAEVEAKPVVEEYEIESRANLDISGVSEACQETQSEEKEDVEGSVNEEDETLVDISSPEVAVDLEKLEVEEEIQLKLIEDGEEKLKEEENNKDDHNEQVSSELASSREVSAASESENNEEETATEESKEEEKETTKRPWEDEETATHDRSDPDDPKLYEQRVGPVSKERENPSKPDNRGSSVLPDCLLLMMCEPKLSMEVSKETWVCSTDFIRWLPEKPVKKKESGDQPKKRISTESRPPPHMLQPPRSSCSFPAPAAPMSMATIVEQKLVGTKPNAYEPFVLTRCKSEPMRSSSTLVPDACFWKNRKVEPHPPPATLGVGAAGVGF